MASSIKPVNHKQGFTLLEILVALFVFMIVTLILSHALHLIITLQTETEKKAATMRTLQQTMLRLSHDIQTIIDRPILEATGQEQASFIGTQDSITFTHVLMANPLAKGAENALQRIRYAWHQQGLWQDTWPQLDLPPSFKIKKRLLLPHVSALHFQYLNTNGQFETHWPITGQAFPFPQAIRLSLTLEDWGDFQQLYVITH